MDSDIAKIKNTSQNVSPDISESIEEMSKKMYPDKSSHALLNIMGFTVPVYHETASSYVDFYYIATPGGEKKRKKIHLDRIKGVRKRRQYAGQLICQLLTKLSSGWRPNLRLENPECTENFQSVEKLTIKSSLISYMERIKRSGRPKTIQSYQSVVNRFSEYLDQQNLLPASVDKLSRFVLIDFLDHIQEKYDVCNRTRNNYRNWLAGYCEWMVDHGHINENPVIRIERVREDEKTRKSLPAGMLEKLWRYLKDNDRNFLLAVMMEYYCFIRPNELRYIRIDDINIKEQKIYVRSEISKNRHDGYVALNKIVILQMIENGIFDNPGEYYIFSKGFRPGTKPASYNQINKRWNELRQELGWPSGYQFYSLKDSGIRDLANSAGIVTARDQARHSDISTTNKYLEKGNAPEEAKHFKGHIG